MTMKSELKACKFASVGIDIGKEVFNSTYNKSIDVSSWNNGIYFVRIINLEAKESYTTKIIIAQ